MLGRVSRALLWHEVLERSRDRWILVLTSLFVLLSAGISLYGKAGDMTQGDVIGPSLVTLSSLLIPLVALLLGFDAIVGERERHTLNLLLSMPIHRGECILAKFIGRFIPLAVAILAGIMTAVVMLPPGNGTVLLKLIAPSLLLGASFLAIGILISSAVLRQATASSLLIAIWFLMVFFYDMAILGILVISDGALSSQWCVGLVVANPAGLYRVMMIQEFGGDDFFAGFGIDPYIPGNSLVAAIWTSWIVGALALSVGSLCLRRERT
jgi:Cu-processing system permease protein